MSGVLGKVTAEFEDVGEARMGWRLAERHEAEIARLAGTLELARAEIASLKEQVAVLQVAPQRTTTVRAAASAVPPEPAPGRAATHSGSLRRQLTALLARQLRRVGLTHGGHAGFAVPGGEGRATGEDRLAPMVAPEGFDEEQYLAAHDDVRQAVAAGHCASGLAHYLWSGRAEGRSLVSTPEGFEEEYYLAANEDVRQAVASRQYASGLAHYLQCGRDEGRPLVLTADGFEEEPYLALHDDVRQAVVSGRYRSGLDHYLRQGQRESRRLTAAPDGFDENQYLAANDDVRRAVSAGEIASGLAHYLRDGKAEGRPLTLAGLIDKRMADVHAGIAGFQGVLEQERTRLDWALGATEGVTAQIDAYHDLRRTADYLAVFDKPEPLVSVCIATVNRSTLLMERAIRSLQEQTYANLQIVVVGDCCTDDTAERIAALGDGRIHFVNLGERGPYPRPGVDRWRVAGTNATNHALSLCEGDFITHLDDDDAFTPDRIQVLLDAARTQRADFLWHPFWYENRDGSWVRVGNGNFVMGQITTGSLFYHRYFARYPWDVHAYRMSEPGDWNRLRKIKLLRPNLHFVDQMLLLHHAEQSQPVFVANDGERFLD